jgi:hypothetical protein
MPVNDQPPALRVTAVICSMRRVRLVVWGPSTKLLAENSELQVKIQEVKGAGVELLACKACSDGCGVSEKLASLGVAVMYMGMPLTEYV